MFRILCGFVLGISVFAPGVSGSVMAIVMGVYSHLIEIVAHPFRNFKKNFIYLIPMILGAAISAVFFVLVFSYLFSTYELASYLFFIGLIGGNLPAVWSDANKGGFKKHYLIGIIAAFAAALIAGIAGTSMATQESALSGSLVYLGICGAVAGMASMIPGVSISMILMVMGVYDTLLFAARSLDFAVIAVVGVCFVTTMILSSRLIKYIFKRFHGFASFMVFGFMCGSMAGIIYGLPAPGADFSWLGGILAMVAGLAISLLFVRLGKKLNTDSLQFDNS